MNKLQIENCVLELPELTYDKSKLFDIFEQVKGYSRVKSLAWSDALLCDVDKAKNVVIQSHDYMMKKEEERGKGISLLQFPYIKDIVTRLNLNVSDAVLETMLDIMWNRPGFKFCPHVDRWAGCVFVWPIVAYGDTDKFNPVDFYNYDGEIVLDSEYRQLTDADIAHTHHYSESHATVFNSHVIHGVRSVSNHRIFLRLRVPEEFTSLRDRYRSGALIKS